MRRHPRTLPCALVAVAVVVLLVAFAPFVFIAVQAMVHHRVVLGVDSFSPEDDLQYLAWVRDAHNGLIRNLYGGVAGQPLFVHPIWSPSGWIQAASGISDVAIMAFWTLIAALVLFAGTAWLVARHISAARPRARIVAVVLALFGGLTPAILLISLMVPGNAPAHVLLAANDLVPAAALWGYAPMAIAVGLMPFVVEGISRSLDGRAGRREQIGVAALALLVAWLHPWQGETLFAVAGGLLGWRAYELWDARRRRDGNREDARPALWSCFRGPLLVAAAAAIPLLYYLVLSRVDKGWAVAQQNDNVSLSEPLALTAVAPLAAIALLAGWRSRRDPAVRGLLLWPIATLLVVAVTRSGQNRALAGLALPVVVLVVRSWPASIRRPRWIVATAAAFAFVAVPLAVFVVDSVQNLDSAPMAAIAEPTHSNVRAAEIAAVASGGLPIVSAPALGAAIPVFADASSWLGQSNWTPDYDGRVLRATLMFLATPTTATERSALGALKTRALVQPCGFGHPVDRALAPLGFRGSRSAAPACTFGTRRRAP